ncbi:unnamed protein product [Dovyalis caffra]|uniref:Copper transport protein n=1 Tax=Dovyalis caffra TaxID=77055 RepID=A0AAV1SFA0_9ROSI|nr:unnamed protein product [Dovyalis caffra]
MDKDFYGGYISDPRNAHEKANSYTIIEGPKKDSRFEYGPHCSRRVRVEDGGSSLAASEILEMKEEPSPATQTHIQRLVKANSSPSVAIEEPLLRTMGGGGKGRWSATRVARVVLFGINSGIGYLLMLAVMSFNAGVFLALVLGLAIGTLMYVQPGRDDRTLPDSESRLCNAILRAAIAPHRYVS